VITRVHHVGAVVGSLDTAFLFWRGAIGLPMLGGAEVPDQGVRAALLGCGPCEIELLEPTRQATGVARFLATRGEGLHHVCFESDDVAREVDRFLASGVQMIDAQPRPGLAGLVAFIHPRACAGVLVEVATPSEGGTSPPVPLEVAAVHVVVDDVEPAARLYRDLFGLSPVTAQPGGGMAQLAVGGVTIQFNSAARTAGKAGLSAIRLVAGDADGLAARLEAQRVPVRRWRGGLVLDPAHANGVPLIIQQRPREDVA
jgi:methylmalonyl-CoA/ethylmalonyl-CoA epimerase